MGAFLIRYKSFLWKVACTVALVAAFFAYNSWAFAIEAEEAEAEAAAAEAIAEAARANRLFPVDGTFSGSAQGFGGPIVVEATISDGAIEKIRIVDASSEDSPYIDDAAKLVDKMVAVQSTEVDAVSGATLSSAGVINAAKEALRAALAAEG